MRSLKVHLIFILFPLVLVSLACGQDSNHPSNENRAVQSVGSSRGEVLVTNEINLDFSKHKVTFIELGADRCIPCRKMQPIMKAIAEEYAGRVQVVFYDVWKNAAPAEYYRIQLIPTQVFIDQKGKEIFRHVGLFPKEEILGMLKDKGIL